MSSRVKDIARVYLDQDLEADARRDKDMSETGPLLREVTNGDSRDSMDILSSRTSSEASDFRSNHTLRPQLYPPLCCALVCRVRRVHARLTSRQLSVYCAPQSVSINSIPHYFKVPLLTGSRVVLFGYSNVATTARRIVFSAKRRSDTSSPEVRYSPQMELRSILETCPGPSCERASTRRA